MFNDWDFSLLNRAFLRTMRQDEEVKKKRMRCLGLPSFRYPQHRLLLPNPSPVPTKSLYFLAPSPQAFPESLHNPHFIIGLSPTPICPSSLNLNNYLLPQSCFLSTISQKLLPNSHSVVFNLTRQSLLTLDTCRCLYIVQS